MKLVEVGKHYGVQKPRKEVKETKESCWKPRISECTIGSQTE